MNAEPGKERRKTVDSVNHSYQEFNFDQWAKQVRPQLLASVHKKGMKY